VPKSPKGPRKGRKAAQAQQAQKLFSELCALFRPHIEPLIRQQCLDQINGPPPTDEQATELLEALRAHLTGFGLAKEDLEEALREAEERIRDPKNITQEEIDAAVADGAAEETGLMVALWITMMMLASYQVANFRVLELQPLDDAMLPPLDEQMQDMFSFGCSQQMLGEQATKDILRAVKAALPAGDQIPACGAELLELQGLTIIK
jgi:hypothetical protein